MLITIYYEEKKKKNIVTTADRLARGTYNIYNK